MMKTFEIKMMRKIVFLVLLMLSLSVFVAAQEMHNDEDFAQAKEWIDNKVSCDNLSNEQLELMGDYYMEQMHPGEAHEVMDKMIGGEGSESLEQMHIAMAKRIYCQDSSYEMMGMMGTGTNMMGGSFGGSLWWLWSIVGMLFWIAVLVALILLIIWLYKKVTGQTTSDGSALEILKKRFAKGEITKKQYEKMKKELR